MSLEQIAQLLHQAAAALDALIGRATPVPAAPRRPARPRRPPQKKTHWTQDPKNAKRMRQNARKAWTARRLKLQAKKTTGARRAA